jgi:carbonic anhydrase
MRPTTLGIGLVFLALAVSASAFAQTSADTPGKKAPAVQTAESQAAMTPASALEKLKKGNARFVEKNMRSRDWLAKVPATAGGQYPFAAILACMDSRAPIEIIFDQGIGDVFGIRLAGNVVNEDVLGSMEYATKVAGSKLLVVLGHTSCGAVKGSIDDAKLGNLTALLAKIRPAVSAIRPRKLERRRVRHESRPGQRVSGDEGDPREEPDDKGSARRRYSRSSWSDVRCLHG